MGLTPPRAATRSGGGVPGTTFRFQTHTRREMISRGPSGLVGPPAPMLTPKGFRAHGFTSEKARMLWPTGTPSRRAVRGVRETNPGRARIGGNRPRGPHPGEPPAEEGADGGHGVPPADLFPPGPGPRAAGDADLPDRDAGPTKPRANSTRGRKGVGRMSPSFFPPAAQRPPGTKDFSASFEPSVGTTFTRPMPLANQTVTLNGLSRALPFSSV